MTKPTKVGRRTFASERDAARFFGVSPPTISRMKREGTLDRLLDPNRDHGNCKAITIRGVTYASARIACDALDVTTGALRAAIERGTLDKLGSRRKRRSKKDEPVEVRGVVYANAKACAKALGVAVEAVMVARRKGRLDTLGVGPGGARWPSQLPPVHEPEIVPDPVIVDREPPGGFSGFERPRRAAPPPDPEPEAPIAEFRPKPGGIVKGGRIERHRSCDRCGRLDGVEARWAVPLDEGGWRSEWNVSALCGPCRAHRERQEEERLAGAAEQSARIKAGLARSIRREWAQ